MSADHDGRFDEVLLLKGQDDVEFASPLQQRLGNQYVGAASELAIADEHVGLGKDRANGLGNGFLFFPSCGEHMAAIMDDRSRPDGIQQGLPLAVRGGQLAGDQCHLASSRSDHAGRGIGPSTGFAEQCGRLTDIAAHQRRLGRRRRGEIILRIGDVRTPADCRGKLPRFGDIAGEEGSRRRIDAGKIAITDQGVLIGKIISAEDDYSILRLVTDESSKFTAAISGSSKVIGETRGKLGAEIELRLIPRDVEINKDDLIITAGLEDAPSGLLVGRVAEVFGDPQNSLKQALVAPAFNQDDLDNIFIIKNY